MSDAVAGALAGDAGGLVVVFAGGDGQENFGAGDLYGRSALGAAALDQERAFVVGEGAERILLTARHGGFCVVGGHFS